MSNFKKLMMAGGAENPAWDLSYAYYDPPAGLVGELSTAIVQNVRFSVASQESSPRAVFFKPDGSKMYITGTATSTVFEYNLSTPWLVDTASYLQSFSMASQVSSASSLFFRADGLKMYAGGFNNYVSEYDLSTAWDVSSASYNQQLDISGNSVFCFGLFFKPDGTEMYVSDATENIRQYSLSTAWDVSSASYLQALNLSATGNQGQDVSFTSDGTRMYYLNENGDTVYEYDLSTAWDISTASSTGSTLFVSAQETTPAGLFVTPDKLYIVGYTDDNVEYYVMGGFSVSAQEATAEGVFFKPDGTKMYIVGSSGDDVNEYDLSTAWDISSATYLQNFSVSAQESNPSDIFFKPDGTKMYIVGNNGDDVNEYDLSTAWDISSASYLQNFSVAAQEISPEGLAFKPDGTKMYIVGSSGDDVNEYDLSTAWDVSSASYNQNFSVAAQEAVPQAIFFKPDGKKMYIAGDSGDDIIEYDLSTAWDISSASYLQNFSVTLQTRSPLGLFFKDDGLQMFTVGFRSDAVFSYTLGVQS